MMRRASSTRPALAALALALALAAAGAPSGADAFTWDACDAEAAPFKSSEVQLDPDPAIIGKEVTFTIKGAAGARAPGRAPRVFEALVLARPRAPARRTPRAQQHPRPPRDARQTATCRAARSRWTWRSWACPSTRAATTCAPRRRAP
jgi:hypothetical protein